MINQRIRNTNFLKKVVSPEVAASVIKDGMTIAASGYRHGGHPRAFFKALAARARKGELKNLSLWSTCLMGYDVEGSLAEANALKRRLGSHGNPALRKAINANKVYCNDMRTEILPDKIRSGLMGKLDVAVVRAIAITGEGHIVPSHVLIDIASYVQAAEVVVVEIDHALPLEIEGIHDVYLHPLTPARKEIPLYDLTDRIGKPYIVCGQDKIKYIIECTEPYSEDIPFFPEHGQSEKEEKIAHFILSFLKDEIKNNRLPAHLLPVECGIGSLPNAALKSFEKEDFNELEFYTPGITDEIIDLIEMDKVKYANGAGFRISMKGWGKFSRNIEKFKKKIILRPIEIINHPEILRRLGIIAINGALEVDVYGNVNNSHISGTHLLHGVGGSCGFSVNAYLSIFTFFSTGKEGNISTIVPMATHVDQSEHTVDVIVTEQGVADLRGLSPVERAEKIITNCAHPDYKPFLKDYLERAKKEVGGHQPHILEEAFYLHHLLRKTGSMKKAIHNS